MFREIKRRNTQIVVYEVTWPVFMVYFAIFCFICKLFIFKDSFYPESILGEGLETLIRAREQKLIGFEERGGEELSSLRGYSAIHTILGIRKINP